MKKIFVCFAALVAMVLMVGCGGSDSKNNNKDNNENSSGTSVCSYGTYECHGNDSYYCGYPDSSNDLMWMLAEKCDNGCDDSIGKCKSDSNDDSADDSDSDKTDSENHDTTPDNGDSADDTDTFDPADDADSSDSQSDNDADTSHGNEPEVGDTRETDCTGLPANASWNTVETITQTWDGIEWKPSTEGTFNETASNTECIFVCNENYSWKNSECEADSRTATCDGLPENAEWNSVSEITQTWSGTNWIPSNIGSFNTEASSSECLFKCNTDYHWENSECTLNSRTNVSCTGLPIGAHWNSVSEISQTWNGTEWIPSSVGSFDENESTSECKFACDLNYTWQNSYCKADSKIVNCDELPGNAQWNSVSTIKQTWNGSEWQPPTTPVYDTTPSVTECRFQCKENKYYDGSSCMSPCDNEPCGQIEHSSGGCTASAWNQYSCNCDPMYNWNGSECEYLPECSTTSATPCIDSASGLIWSSKAPEAMTWSYAVSYCENLSEGGLNIWRLPSIDELRHLVYDCPSTVAGGTCGVTNSCLSYYCLSDDSCFCNGANSSKLGDRDLPLWSSSTVSNATNFAWGIYFRQAQINYYEKEDYEDYFWLDARCVIDSTKTERTASCTGLPVNAVWNTASSIKQTWNGTNWTPSTTGTYNASASTKECRFKCKNGYKWNGSKCVGDSSSLPGVLGRICTGQNKCYNNTSSITCPKQSSADFFGQDLYYAEEGKCKPQSFKIDSSVSSNKTTIDNNTGLEWQQSNLRKFSSFSEASSHCEDLNYGGHKDWRIPNVRELFTIVDLSKSEPSIDSAYFPDTPSDIFWASYDVTVDFGFSSGTNPAYVRCVRGNELPRPSLTTSTADNGDVFVNDSTTNLMWQKTYATGKNWKQALSYCENLNYAGYSDWRLPNKNELLSIVANNYSSAEIPENSLDFWSSSTRETEPGLAWTVGVYSSSSYSMPGISVQTKVFSSNDTYVRCVRN